MPTIQLFHQHSTASTAGPKESSWARGTVAHAQLIPPSSRVRQVFLGGISNDTNEDSLQAYCGQWGELADVHVLHGKGYAFVTFAAVPTAQAFLEVGPGPAGFKGRAASGGRRSCAGCSLHLHRAMRA